MVFEVVGVVVVAYWRRVAGYDFGIGLIWRRWCVQVS